MTFPRGARARRASDLASQPRTATVRLVGPDASKVTGPASRADASPHRPLPPWRHTVGTLSRASDLESAVRMRPLRSQELGPRRGNPLPHLRHGEGATRRSLPPVKERFSGRTGRIGGGTDWTGRAGRTQLAATVAEQRRSSESSEHRSVRPDRLQRPVPARVGLHVVNAEQRAKVTLTTTATDNSGYSIGGIT